MSAPGESVRLAWVVTADGTHPVSDFVGLPAEERPETFCPGCRGKVVLKLGDERAHHAAHEPGATCALTRTNPLLRMNTVLHAWWALQRANAVLVQLRCSCPRPCGLVRATVVTRDWTEVRVRAPDGTDPWDVLCLRGDVPLFALRVSTRDLAESTRAGIDAMGIPWIEIHARTGFYAGPDRWTASAPLDPDAAWAGLPHWISPECLQREAIRPTRPGFGTQPARGGAPESLPPPGGPGGPRAAAPRKDPTALQVKVRLVVDAEVEPRGKAKRTDVFRLSQVWRGDVLVRTELTRHRGSMLSETIASVSEPCGDLEPRMRAAMDQLVREETARGTRITFGEWDEPAEGG